MTGSPGTGTATERNLRVLIADEDEAALRALHDTLARLGHEVTPYAVSVTHAAELIAGEDPDLAIVVVHEDDEHALALIDEAVQYASGPVIAQMTGADAGFLSRAAERGISAYVESSHPDAIQGAIEVALRRHRQEVALTEKVEQLQTALDRRAVIERAKGILMERHRAGEQQAFDLLRDQARSTGRRVVDVAQSVVDGHALLPRG